MKQIVNVLVLTNNQNYECAIIIQDGGYATIHNNGYGLLTTYHQSRLVNDEDIYAETNDGKQYHKDWEGQFDVTPEMINDAIKWLFDGDYDFAIITKNVDLVENEVGFIRDFLFNNPFVTIHIPKAIIEVLDKNECDEDDFESVPSKRFNVFKEYIDHCLGTTIGTTYDEFSAWYNANV